MSAILSGARKYGLGLVLAHQDLDQLLNRDSELANSVLSNPAIRVCFRYGDKDAAKLEDGFCTLNSTDLQSLKVGQAIMRVGQKDCDFNVSFDLLPKTEHSIAERKIGAIIEYCRSTYAIPRSEVEQMLRDALQIGAVSSRSDSEAEVVQESKALHNHESIDKIKPARLPSHRLVNFLIWEAGAFESDFRCLDVTYEYHCRLIKFLPILYSPLLERVIGL